MRVSSGVRNLIAGGDGGGAGEGAGRAPGASPPPVPAHTGAAQESATGTLAAGRADAKAPATALDTADALTGVRRESLDALVNTVDARVGEDVDEAGARPPQSTTQAYDFLSADRRLRDLRNHYRSRRDKDIANDFDRISQRVSRRVVQNFEIMGGRPADLLVRPSGVARADMAYLVLQETARQADRDRDLERAGAIRDALVAIDKEAVEELKALSGNHGIADDPAARVILQQPVTAGPKVTVAAIPPPTRTPVQFDWASAYRQLRDLAVGHRDASRDAATMDFYRCANRIAKEVMDRFRDLGGDSESLPRTSARVSKAELAYRAIENMSRQATESGEATRAYQLRGTLEFINRFTFEALGKLTDWYGELDALSPQDLRAMERLPREAGPKTSAALSVTVRPPATVPSTTAPPLGRLDIPDPVHPIALEVTSTFSEPADWLVRGTGVGPPPATGLPGPSLAEAAGAEVGDLGRGWLDPPATEAIVTHSFGETSSFWLQPVDPVPAPGSVSIDFGRHHAGETVQPPPVATGPGSTASDPGAPFLASPRLDDDVAVERRRNEPAAPSTASATGWAEFWLTEIDPFLGTGEGASHPAPHAPPAAPGRTGAGAVAPPTAADSWRIRPPGMSGGPHPVAFGPWSAPPGSSSHVVYTETIPTPVPSTGAPPGLQGAETPGFARAASGAVELSFSRRQEIARRFSTEDALLEAELALQTGGAGTLGWPALRWRELREDLQRLHDAIVQSSSAAAATVDVDWNAIEALARVLKLPVPPP